MRTTSSLYSAAHMMCALVATAALVQAQPAVTVYNQNFAVVRETIPLDLKTGINRVEFAGATSLLEPDSVVLRDHKGKRELQVVEQYYRADPVSQPMLLSLFEGKTIDFRVQKGEKTEIVQGKIIRSGYTPGTSGRGYGGGFGGGYDAQIYAGPQSPIIEVDGKLQFSLPGEPLFPALPDSTILKPTLNWLLRADQPGPLTAEMAYVTGGMTWEADYNIVAPENANGQSDTLDITGWVTLANTSGKTFENARIKLMAGDVNKTTPNRAPRGAGAFGGGFGGGAMPDTVTEKTFDEYHLYTLTESTTLRDRETKQVEFARGTGIKSQRLYIYDGAQVDRGTYTYGGIRGDESYGTTSNSKVMVMREFKNTKENGLGIPLPKGRLRFYRRDADGQLEFIGENTIDHTPKDEMVRVATGNAFDLVGERKRTAYKIDSSARYIDESFEIKVRNHKSMAAQVRIVEHLYRGANWSITAKSTDSIKTDSNTVEFPVQIAPDSAQTVTYTVHYTWYEHQQSNMESKIRGEPIGFASCCFISQKIQKVTARKFWKHILRALLTELQPGEKNRADGICTHDLVRQKECRLP